MKILVGAKRVVDPNVKVRVSADGTGIDAEHSKMSLNPFDENAIEEAVRLKEKNPNIEIIALSIGNEKSIDVLRTAMARGCDRAILVFSENNLEPIMVAKVFKHIVKQENPEIILLGKQAIDDDANQVGQMLAGMLNYPQGTFISKLQIDDNKVIVAREMDSGTETLELKLPVVLTADLHLNEPRFIKLPQLMMAKKKPIEQLNFDDLGISYKESTVLLQAYDGEIKKSCKMLDNVEQLIEVLKEKKAL